jgi:hypothetical protein
MAPALNHPENSQDLSALLCLSLSLLGLPHLRIFRMFPAFENGGDRRVTHDGLEEAGKLPY